MGEPLENKFSADHPLKIHNSRHNCQCNAAIQMQIADRIIKAIRANETLIELSNCQRDTDRFINETQR